TKATKESLGEAKKVRELFKLATDHEPDEFSQLIERRNYWTVIRTCAWIARFVHNARNKIKKVGPLTTEEIEAQKKFWEEKTRRQGEASEKYDADRMRLNLQRNQSRLLDVEMEDDIQMPLITPESMMRPQSNLLPELEPHLEETVPLRKRAKYIKKCKDTMWKRWTHEYLRGLRERHNLKHSRSSGTVEKGEVVIIKGDEKDSNQWKLGIVEKVLPGKDGIVRAGRNQLERHLYPLELSCDIERNTKTKLNPEIPAF
ncbi:Hypothetical predicted protein, partial [Paramuricea clavata]